MTPTLCAYKHASARYACCTHTMHAHTETQDSKAAGSLFADAQACSQPVIPHTQETEAEGLQDQVLCEQQIEFKANLYKLVRLSQNGIKGAWSHSSMVEHLPSTSKVLGSIPITGGRERKEGKREKRGKEEKRRKKEIEMLISHLPACSPL